MRTITRKARRLGGRAVGSRGSGKTLFAAYQTYMDFLLGTGAIVIDPMGSFTKYLFNRIAWSGHKELWDRVVYVPMGGMPIDQDVWVVPTPFLYQTDDFDALHDRTQRVVDLWKQLNPQQESAPIQGMPSIERTADHLGMLLAAMGKQLVPDAGRMLEDPVAWLPLAEAVAAEHPYELAAPLTTFKLYANPKFSHNNERSETLSFLNKIGPSTLNPRLSAQYGANEWGVQISDVEQGKLIVFDCGALTSRSEKRSATTWIFSACMEYFASRGPRRDIVGFVIDELSYLTDVNNTLLEDQFEDLIMRISRNFGVFFFTTYQKVTQPSERMQKILDELGYSLFGAAADAASAARLVELLDTYEPKKIKEQRWQYAPSHIKGDDAHQLVATYYTAQEQALMNQEKHRNRRAMTFALAMNEGEGSAATYQGTYRITSIQETQEHDEDPPLIAKRNLVKTHGRKVADVIAEIEARKPQDPIAPALRRTRTRSAERPGQDSKPADILMDVMPPTPPVRRSGPPPRTSID